MTITALSPVRFGFSSQGKAKLENIVGTFPSQTSNPLLYDPNTVDVFQTLQASREIRAKLQTQIDDIDKDLERAEEIASKKGATDRSKLDALELKLNLRRDRQEFINALEQNEMLNHGSVAGAVVQLPKEDIPDLLALVDTFADVYPQNPFLELNLVSLVEKKLNDALPPQLRTLLAQPSMEGFPQLQQPTHSRRDDHRPGTYL